MVKISDIRQNTVICSKHRQRRSFQRAVQPWKSPSLGKDNTKNKTVDKMRALKHRNAWLCLEIQLLGIACTERFTFLVENLWAIEFMIELHGMLHGMIALRTRHTV